ALARAVVQHLGHDPGFPSYGVDRGLSLSRVMEAAMTALMLVGVESAFDRPTSKRTMVRAAMTRQDPNASLVLGLTGPDTPSPQDLERSLGQGLQDPLLKESASLLWILGQR